MIFAYLFLLPLAQCTFTLTYLQLIALPSIRTVAVLRTVTIPLCPYLSIVCVYAHAATNDTVLRIVVHNLSVNPPISFAYCNTSEDLLFVQQHIGSAFSPHMHTSSTSSSLSLPVYQANERASEWAFNNVLSLSFSRMTLDPFRKCHNTRINLCTKFGCKSFEKE